MTKHEATKRHKRSITSSFGFRVSFLIGYSDFVISLPVNLTIQTQIAGARADFQMEMFIRPRHLSAKSS